MLEFINRAMRIVLTVSCIFILSISFSQEYTPGTIQLKNGNLLEGSIKDKDWLKNPDEILFKNPNGNIGRLTPTDILGFTTSKGRKFKSQITTIDKSEHRNTVISKNRTSTPILVLDTVFLEVLITGDYSLYKLLDENSKTHFFIEHQDAFEELIEKKIYSTTNHAIATIPVFQSQLQAMATGCDNLTKKTSKLSLKEKTIGDFILNLNACRQAEVTYYKAHEKIDIEFYLGAGISVSNIKMDYSLESLPNSLPIAAEGFSTSITPTINFGTDFVFPKNKRIFSIYTELGYQYIHSTSENDFVIDIHYLKIFTGIRFTEPKNRRLFAHTGLSNSFAISHSTDGLITDLVKSGGKQLYQDGFRGHSQGLYLGIGYRIFKDLVTELRIENTNGFSSYSALATPILSGYLTFYYKF